MSSPNWKLRWTIVIVISFLTCVIIISLLLNQAKVRRDLKSIGSNFSNGLNRTITVYDYNGNEIKSWTGKYDVTESETGILFDDQDGKRVIITGGIVINEELD